MAEAWGGILQGLGGALAGIYTAIPSYAVAIIVLTVGVRLLLIPLTVKQIRSMNAMQKIQPHLKQLQQKHKGDRQKLNEEMMTLYREHGVNPLGGCFPIIMQAPVFIALFSVLRAATPAIALPAPGASIPAEVAAKNTVCRPGGDPSVTGQGSMQIVCTPEGGQALTIQIKEWQDRKARSIGSLPYLTRCQARKESADSTTVRDFVCQSPVGTGHLPRDSRLFGEIIADHTRFAGMEMACSPTDAASKVKIQQCAPPGTKAGGTALAGYYTLVLLMVGTTYYQQKQMSARAQGPQAAQMQMMTRIMPVFLGFISLNIPAGVLIYWAVSNVWTIGQQTVFLRKQGPVPAISGGDGKGPKQAPALGRPAKRQRPGGDGKRNKGKRQR
ncbi:MAG: membrane protein insertase YidC [Acidobacteria bacterium]|nr:membrane protein insertase YidC [Acidobacteriota bacterium]